MTSLRRKLRDLSVLSTFYGVHLFASPVSIEHFKFQVKGPQEAYSKKNVIPSMADKRLAKRPVISNRAFNRCMRASRRLKDLIQLETTTISRCHRCSILRSRPVAVTVTLLVVLKRCIENQEVILSLFRKEKWR